VAESEFAVVEIEKVAHLHSTNMKTNMDSKSSVKVDDKSRKLCGTSESIQKQQKPPDSAVVKHMLIKF
jgi:hypothetical protein